MVAFKITTAVLAAFFVPSILADGPYSDSQSTVTAEPQPIGSVTVNGGVVYSLNMCTIVQTTACQVSLSTSAQSIVADSSPTPAVPTDQQQPGGASTPAAAGTETGAPGQSAGTPIVVSNSEGLTTVQPAPEAATNTYAPVTSGVAVPMTSSEASEASVTVISTTDSAGNPTLVTSSSVVASTSGAGSSTSESFSATAGSNSTSGAATSGKPSKTGAPTSGSDVTAHLAPSVLVGALLFVFASIF